MRRSAALVNLSEWVEGGGVQATTWRLPFISPAYTLPATFSYLFVEQPTLTPTPLQTLRAAPGYQTVAVVQSVKGYYYYRPPVPSPLDTPDAPAPDRPTRPTDLTPRTHSRSHPRATK